MSDEGEILLGCWDCDACGARGVLGDAYACPSCGAPRPEDVRFYLPTDAERVEDAAGIAAANAGPDWQCAFCDRWNPATAQACVSCAASVSDSERRQRERRFSEASVPRTPEDVTPDPRPVVAPRARRARRGGSGIPRAALIGGGAFVLAALGACLLFAKWRGDLREAYRAAVEAQREVVAEAKREFDAVNAPLIEASARLSAAEAELASARRDLRRAQRALAATESELRRLELAREGTVAAHSWTVQIGVERCGAVAGEGWSHPPDAFDVRSEDRVHHTERVLDRVETRYREEAYRAQEGYDTETYTEREARGTRRVPDGHTITDLGNGRFKKTPRYRTETVYETVTKTRQVPRYVTKTRQVPYEEEIYRDDPVRRPWYRYRTWSWLRAPPLQRSGEGLAPLDPPGTPALQVVPAEGALRQVSREVEWVLVVGYLEGDEDEQPLDESRWQELRDGDPVILLTPEVLRLSERDARIAALETRRDQQRAPLPQLDALAKQLEEPLPRLREAISPLLEATQPARQRLERERAKLAEIQHDRPY